MNAPALPVKPRPKVDLDATRERLLRVGLVHAAERLGERLADATQAELAPHGFLDRLLEDELSAREERRVRTSLRLSALPTGQTLASFDFAFQPSVERSRIETLATCAWVRAKETLLIQGPPGVGRPTWGSPSRSRRSSTASRSPSTGWRSCSPTCAGMPTSRPRACAAGST